MSTVRIRDVRSFWEAHPLAAADVPHALGTREFFDYYDRLREANETVVFSRRLHEYERFAGKRVLDVGCGNGYVLSRYAQYGAEVCGVDITHAGARLCGQRFAHLGLRGAFFVANAEQLPFESERFDCVCSMGVLHHTPDTRGAVKEVFRVLKPGGRLIVMFYHRDSAMYRLRFPLLRLTTGKTIQQLLNEVDGAGNPKGDVYSRSELRTLLADFDEIEIFPGFLEGGMLIPRGGRLIPKSVLRALERRWGWFLYAKAVKPAALPQRLPAGAGRGA